MSNEPYLSGKVVIGRKKHLLPINVDNSDESENSINTPTYNSIQTPKTLSPRIGNMSPKLGGLEMLKNTSEPLTKTHLNSDWRLWFHEYSSNDWSDSSYKYILTVDTLENFFGMLTNVHMVGTVNEWYIYLMRNKIRPTYEDVNNRSGYMLSIKSETKLDEGLKLWSILARAIVCEHLITSPGLMDLEENYINGISIAHKTNSYIIKVWVSKKNYSFEEIKKSIRSYITENYGNGNKFSIIQNNIVSDGKDPKKSKVVTDNRQNNYNNKQKYTPHGGMGGSQQPYRNYNNRSYNNSTTNNTYGNDNRSMGGAGTSSYDDNSSSSSYYGVDDY